MSIQTIFKPKAKAPVVLTADQRLNASHTQAAAALSFFEAAAADLAAAAIDQDAIAGEFYDEIERLEQKAQEAVSASVENAAAASRIRELVGSVVG